MKQKSVCVRVVDFAKGFGGKFGVDSNAQDKSAVDYSHRESVPTHPSQKGKLNGGRIRDRISKMKMNEH